MWFFPPRHGCLALSCSMWSVHTLVLLLLLQKNWLCASQDDSLLPLTALAELTMGDYRYTTDMTKLHPLHSLSCSFSSSLSLCYIPPLQFKHSNETIWKTDDALHSLWTAGCDTTTTWLQNHSISTTACLDNTNALFLWDCGFFGIFSEVRAKTN